MKPLKLVCMAMICMVAILVSCSGSDGETGPQGKPGIDGSDGTNGVNGTNGVDGEDGEDGVDGIDGTANAQKHIFDVANFFMDYTFISFDLNNVLDEPANYAYLYYLVRPVNEDEFTISLPGFIQNDIYTFVTTYLNPESAQYGTFYVYFRQDGNPVQIDGSPYPELIVVSIELNNASKTSESVMKELKLAGVDTSDYSAVAEYFGLE